MADGAGLALFDLAAGLSPGSPAAGPAVVLGAGLAVRAAGLAVAGLADVVAAGAEVSAGAEVAAGPIAAAEPAGAGSAADDAAGVDEAGPGVNGAAVLLDAVHPAVTRTGTSTSAAAIRRMPAIFADTWPMGPV
jgi:hypothetical protein